MNERRIALSAALLCAASALGGCAATHIGDDWQCPLTQGAPCLTVPGADPAAPGHAEGAAPPRDPARSAGRGASEGRTSSAGGSSPAGRRPASRPTGNDSEREHYGTEDGSEPGRAICNAWCRPFAWLWGRGTEGTVGDGAESDGNAVVGRDAEAALGPAGAPGNAPATASDDLRTPEVVGRIWIAPHVDANGVYREASWVRVVLEPARWRLP